MFEFDARTTASTSGEDFFESPRVAQHIRDVVKKLETVFQMMKNGEFEELGEHLREIGCRHRCYGIKPSDYVLLERAFLRALEMTLNDSWTRQVRKDWTEIIRFFSQAMVIGSDYIIEIKKQERGLGELSVATLSLSVVGTAKVSRCSSGSSSSSEERFHTERTVGERRLSDPPKPAPRSMFNGFFYDTLPSVPRRHSDADLSKGSAREFGFCHTPIAPGKKVKPLKLPPLSPDPTSLLLGSTGSSSRKLGPINEKLADDTRDHLPKAPCRRMSPCPTGHMKKTTPLAVHDSMLQLQSLTIDIEDKAEKQQSVAPSRRISHHFKPTYSKSSHGNAIEAFEDSIDIIDNINHVSKELIGRTTSYDSSPRLPRRTVSPIPFVDNRQRSL
eukprot:scaffold1143_cov96-Cylindrotheca_fusiformis.AAC.2